ncbi:MULTISPECIES: hypothetical protein [unclassified Streptomyces]|uniref:hypothetical protein n=1 Tax=unclassified Streptomyces TaxID=2593676 RepID=UPI002DD8818C|nr:MULTISPECIES: hypothetical protein [unclassified Streptomyces]WSA91390.1 hypothetical protein OIE63_07340 [Streptomyces sp. NBC_01795]WSB75714.1 hypothetical protein OHB04_07865 [Streptomyces sp. NBC_01775]WSS16001.1 hypothetical protein OG533_32020 [Streptomyces sp. NBC_01186]WSS44819.1 hypothetical protein OG220_32700 [Streptomyces sp. NBC_01187]
MAEPADRAGTDEPRSPWLRSGFVLAAAFIGFVVVIGSVVLFTSDSSGRGDGSTAASASETGTPQPGDGATESPPSVSTDGGGASCPRLADRQRDVPTAAPKGVGWKLFHTVALPASKAAGPAVMDEDVARCYAHTPVGALLATSQISVRYLAADDWLKVTRAQTVGAGRKSYIAARTKSESTADPKSQDGAGQGQIAGFKFVTYTSSTAVIQTVWRFPDGRMQAATTTVLWKDGDWRLEYPADPTAPTAVDSLAGYVSWGGV